ncbi:cyclic nucleotide-binding domain-containing protein [Maridesulfovibrio sp.]|uniref:cyclic nucleotide-binding domain-containing protein n=1 Tax=Maridesulfovibrio sp. TaxID=2795000 RepID=UPI002A187FAB|nr:cyclic nucleotide-binding domain-containing protein [Maridesulfovibrio sp.]
MTDFWKSIPLFQELADDELAPVKNIFHSVSVPAGTNIITEGDEGDEMFILVNGKVRVSKRMLIKGMNIPLTEMKNPRKVLANLDDSSYPVFGEIALIDRDIRSATVAVVEDSEFLVTHRDRFFELAESHPSIGCKLFMTIGRRLSTTVRRSNNEIVKLTTALALALSRPGR